MDSLNKLEFIPESIAGNQPVGKRESNVKFEKEEAYFTHTFNYMKAADVDDVKIIFDGINYAEQSPKDFVLFIFRD